MILFIFVRSRNLLGREFKSVISNFNLNFLGALVSEQNVFLSMIDQNPKTYSVRWSARLKHSGITIYNNEAHLDSTSGHFVCILAEPASPDSQQLIWTLRIVSMMGLGLLVGVCHRNTSSAFSNNFKHSQWASPGHGNYLIGSNGWLYSHCDRSSNSASANFILETGNLLQFWLNQKIGKMIVKKGDEIQEFRIQKQGQKCLPCVYMGSERNIVEIVQNRPVRLLEENQTLSQAGRCSPF